ncbi:DNA-formamidopyrimidine glycosylase family protein [Mucilaginibacter sp. R-33]|uniref:DNA-formamidopyrimidine glycosylase family protein n=1 Tax=Mucilaginibacter sp. R-33 TaxID=3416711 RepID=UPI003CEF7C19
MPEIPDLNIFSSNLAKQLEGKMLSLIDILITRQLKVPVAEIEAALEGQVLRRITRIGKELHFDFQNGHVLSIHLMLHGTMYWFESKNENRFTIAELLFEDGTGLAITDWQKAVILTLDPKPAAAPDAMDISSGYLQSALAKTSKPIKTVLTEGKTVQGIGNAYVDEILYAAKISPFSKANKIPETNIDILVQAINTVLVDAENHIRRNFPDTITEKERDFLQVHRPKQALTLNGEVILKAELDKRKTYYVESQQLFE